MAVLYTDYAGSSTSSGNAHSFLARVDGTTVTQLADLGAGSIYPRLQATDDGLFVAWNSQAAGAPRQGMMQEFGLDGTAVSGPVSISPAYADTADLTSTYSGVSSSLVDTADISVNLTKFAVSGDVAGSVLVYRGQDSFGDSKFDTVLELRDTGTGSLINTVTLASGVDTPFKRTAISSSPRGR